MTLGEIIKKYREEHGMSMDAFSEVSHISKAYISLLEKNRHPKTGKPIAPSIEIIKQAADGMGMDFNELFAMIDSDVDISAPQAGTAYYLNEETAKIAQEVFDDPDLRVLFDASRNAKPEAIRLAAEMLRQMKETNPDG